ncbi:uncharacterized protein LOC114977050 [Acropora millepora]|uniref:uncharacterized protein LOC114977050 n=1 Tax=Acropora millepora TaxID=45264 RepID=UPI001CF4C743|nr:uncharacterized protein LOC114977050 [Acropora millepora]
MLVSMVRFLAISHIVVGVLLFIFGIADGVTSVLGIDDAFFAGYGFFGVWTGTWMCIAGALGISGSTPQRTSARNCYAGLFMGFAITSAVFGGIIIIMYSSSIENASYFYYNCSGDMDPVPTTRCNLKYSYKAKLGLAVVILILGIIEVVTGVWVSICLCLMNLRCRHLEELEPLVIPTLS